MKSFANPDFASRSRDKARPKIGVVLGSGGIKALASIPLFDFLYEAGIDIDLLVGCSGGGVIASLRGAGYDTDQMRKFAYDVWVRELFTKVDYRSALAIPNLPFGRFDQSSGILKNASPSRRIVFWDISCATWDSTCAGFCAISWRSPSICTIMKLS